MESISIILLICICSLLSATSCDKDTNKKGMQMKQSSEVINEAFTLTKQGKYSQAIIILKNQLKKESDNLKKIKLCFFIGDIHGEMEQEDKAISYYRRVLQIDPKNALAYFEIGQLFKRIGSLEKAIDAFKKSYELGYNKHDEVLANIAFCYKALADTNRQDPEKCERYANLALKGYMEVLKINENNKSVLMNSSDLLFNFGNYDKALEGYTKLSKLMPKNPMLFTRMGHTLHVLGKNKEAVKTLKHAINLLPELIKDIEESTEATKHDLSYAKAMFITGKVSANLYLAETFRAMGELENARKRYHTVVSLAKQHGNDFAQMEAWKNRALDILKELENK
ncbi:tetratricopeptide repeat protein [Candidatus Uabimicrobium sp. HlEnr_7]|uniref:tetratricopeptide repeat protein n=1 Tax=Candidatus Uabimicrobium helgolandensis TaxID=3095367 RepID=UPI003556DCDA